MGGQGALHPGSGFSTRAIHAGQEPDLATGAVVVPIYQTSTYAQGALGRNKGYEYARTHNLTRASLERNLAALEGGRHGLCFASGLAATNCLMQTLSAGDHVVAGNNLYGGTYRLFVKVLEGQGLQFSFVDATDLDTVERAFRPNTRLLVVETPTNPMMQLTDIAAVSERAHARGVRVVVDNTFMTPFFQRPLELGADVVLHSLTKYLNGHSDMVGGALVTGDDALAEQLRFLQNAAGAVPGPMDCWLALAGHQDPGGAHAAPRRERPGLGGPAGGEPPGLAGAVSRAGEPPPARTRPSAGLGVRGHDLVRPG